MPLEHLPYWPAAMRRDEALAYTSVAETQLKETRSDYKNLMDMLVHFPTKAGRLGVQVAAKVVAAVADALHKKLRKHDERERLEVIIRDRKQPVVVKEAARAGLANLPERQGTYAMQVCCLVWSHSVRHKKTTGVSENPFMGMGLKSTAKNGNRAATRAEYDLYRETARDLGFQSMATAAALGFEGAASEPATCSATRIRTISTSWTRRVSGGLGTSRAIASSCANPKRAIGWCCL